MFRYLREKEEKREGRGRKRGEKRWTQTKRQKKETMSS
jgi:hypothetical protein